MVCHRRTSDNIKTLKLKSRVNKKQEIAPKQSNISLPNNSHDFLKNVKPKLLGKSKGCKRATSNSNVSGGLYELISLKPIKYLTQRYSKFVNYTKKSRRNFGIQTIQRRFNKPQLIGKIYTYHKNRYKITRKIL